MNLSTWQNGVITNGCSVNCTHIHTPWPRLWSMTRFLSLIKLYTQNISHSCRQPVMKFALVQPTNLVSICVINFLWYSQMKCYHIMSQLSLSPGDVYHLRLQAVCFEMSHKQYGAQPNYTARIVNTQEYCFSLVDAAAFQF